MMRVVGYQQTVKLPEAEIEKLLAAGLVYRCDECDPPVFHPSSASAMDVIADHAAHASP